MPELELIETGVLTGVLYVTAVGISSLDGDIANPKERSQPQSTD